MAATIDDLLQGHYVEKFCNSGKDYGMTKNGSFSKPNKKASKAWLKKVLIQQDIEDLMMGVSVGITVRRGRGFSYMELTRIRNKE